MVLEIGMSLPTTLNWGEIATGVVKWTPEILATATGISLAFKKVRAKIYSFYDYFYNKLPSVKAQLEKMNEIAAGISNMTDNFGSKLDRIERRGIVTQSLAWSMLEDMDAGKILTDEKGKWRRANKTFLKWIAATDDDILGDGWVTYLTEDCRRYVVTEYIDAIDHRRGVEFKCSFKRNGTMIYNINFMMKPTKSDGVVYGYEITLKKI